MVREIFSKPSAIVGNGRHIRSDVHGQLFVLFNGSPYFA